MKAISKAKIWIGAVSAPLLLVAIVLGVANPAVAPTTAEAVQPKVLPAKKKMAKQQVIFAKYQNADSLSDLELAELLSAVGFQGKDLVEAWAVAKKETNGRPLAHNGNRKTGDNSWGIFQINMLGKMGKDRREKFGLRSNADLLNPVVNAKIAYHMSNGGKDWSAWSNYSHRTKAWMKKFPKHFKAKQY